jgi:hypothetical protein
MRSTILIIKNPNITITYGWTVNCNSSNQEELQ